MSNNKEDLNNLRDKIQKQLDTKNYANEDVKEALENPLELLMGGNAKKALEL